MAVLVVDAFEMIDVEHDQRERIIVQMRLGKLDDGAPIEGSG
jgi:hypothetical protein